jgi:hypothetical protein
VRDDSGNKNEKSDRGVGCIFGGIDMCRVTCVGVIPDGADARLALLRCACGEAKAMSWRAFVVAAAVFAGLEMVPMSAFAQTASQITPPSFRPDLERQSGFALPGTPGLATPAGAEKLFVKLSGVSIKGGLPALASEAAALEAKLTGVCTENLIRVDGATKSAKLAQ